MAGFNISMERINNDYSRVSSISEENETFKRELYGLYESQEGICKDLIRTLTAIKRKNSEAIKGLRSAIKSNEELLSARVDARHDWET